MNLYEKIKSFGVDEFKIKYNLEILQELTKLELHKKIEYELLNNNYVKIKIKKIIQVKKIKKEVKKYKDFVIDKKPRFFSYMNIRSKYPEETFIKILDMHNSGMSLSKISISIKICKSSVSKLLRTYKKNNEKVAEKNDV